MDNLIFLVNYVDFKVQNNIILCIHGDLLYANIKFKKKKYIFLWISGIWETADIIVRCLQIAFQTAHILYFEVWKPS